MIEKLAQILMGAGLSADYRDIRDALWLAKFLPRPGAVKAEAKAEPSAPARPAPVVQEPAPPPSEREKIRRRVVVPGASQETPVYTSGLSAAGSHPAGASRVRAPGVSALPKALAISRALRPFSRRFPSRRDFTLDEEATVQLVAELSSVRADLSASLFLSPVFRPRKERWFDVALVVEDAPSLEIWSQSISEFSRLLGQVGIFSDVRSYSLKPVENGVRVSGPSGAMRSPKELRHPTSRRLILVVSDCVSEGWRDGRMDRALREWGETTPVTLVQVLAERLWRHTAVGAPDVYVESLMPGLPNSQLSVVKEWWDTEPVGRDMALPVISLEPVSIGRWAASLMGAGLSTGAVLLRPDSGDEERGPGEVIDEPVISAEERVRRFRSLVSPEAFQFAAYLSAVPLTLEVMRLVQETMLPQTGQSHLAEVLLGGIIQREVAAEGKAAGKKGEYQFYEGVREILGTSMLRSELMRVLQAVSRFVTRRAGRSLDFEALVADPSGAEALPEDAIPFARVGAEALRRMGGLPISLGKQQSETGVGAGKGIEEVVYAPGLTIRRSREHMLTIRHLAYSPDGRKLAVLDTRGITIISAETGESLHQFAPQTSREPMRFPESPSIYMSYAPEDGQGDLILNLSDSLKAALDNRVTVYPDWSEPRFGKMLLRQLHESTVFLLIITPGYLRNPHCRYEMNEFIIDKKLQGVTPYIIPILLSDTPPLDDPASEDEVVREIKSRQWADWRELRKMPLDLPPARLAIKRVAEWIEMFLQREETEGQQRSSDEPQYLPDFSSVAWSWDSKSVAFALNGGLSTTSNIFLISEYGSVRPKFELKSKFEFKDLPGTIRRLSWRPGTPQIAMSLSNGSIIRWHPDEHPRWETNRAVETGRRESAGIPAIAWSPDGQHLAAVYQDGTIHFSADNAPVHSPPENLKRPLTEECTHIIWASGSEMVAATQSRPLGIVLWSLERTVITHAGIIGASVLSMSASSDGKLIAAALENGAMKIWRTDNRQAVCSTEQQEGARPIRQVDFSPSSAELAAAEGSTIHFLRVHDELLNRGEEDKEEYKNVHINFSPIYRGKQFRILDNSSKVIATGVFDEMPYKLRLAPPATYTVEIPSLQRRETVTPQPKMTSVLMLTWEFKERWVLVAGTGSYTLTDAQLLASEALGGILAEAGYGLITGGWRGVDHVVARAFTERIRVARKEEDKYLIQIVPAGGEADFKGGQVVTVAGEEAAYAESLSRASAVVLIGGVGGTYEIYRRARLANLPVLPLPATGGDAQRIYNQLLTTGGSGEIEPLRSLDAPISNAEDARRLVEKVILKLAALPEASHSSESVSEVESEVEPNDLP
ncbi:MAG TPA: SAV_2336 N-terminal domain-related protein [Blastocatellia bacterium]|nr:SAV_2336 N-terminal domain-related protein [Blastocatellia bacterium]